MDLFGPVYKSLQDLEGWASSLPHTQLAQLPNLHIHDSPAIGLGERANLASYCGLERIFSSSLFKNFHIEKSIIKKKLGAS